MDYQTLTAEILDDTGRTTDTALLPKVQGCVLSAVRFYERKRFYFNERRTSFSVTTSQEWITSTDLTDLPGIVEFDALSIRLETNIYELTRRTFAYLEEIMSSTSSFGDPTEFCIYQQQIRLYPVTQLARPLTASYLYKPATLSASTDSNVWTTEAVDLIKYRAEWDLYARVIKDLEAAGVAKQQEIDTLGQLEEETLLRASSGKVQPMKGGF